MKYFLLVFVAGFLALTPILSLDASAVSCSEYVQSEFSEAGYVTASCKEGCPTNNLEVFVNAPDLICPGPAVCCAVKPGTLEPPAPKSDAAQDAAKAAASKGSPGSTTKLNDPLKGATLFGVINRLITAFLGMVGALALGVFVYAGVLWMTAGDSKRVQTAKDTMKYAVIGLAMIAFAYAITTFFIDALTGAAVPVDEEQQAAQEAVPLGE